MNKFACLLAIAAALFSIFPLTDTDIWWHLACAREWVTTWTPVRTPVVNVHEYFQQVVGFVYDLGGAPLLVAFKAILWGFVFFLFSGSLPRTCSGGIASHNVAWQSLVPIVLLFVFRYHFEIRPVLFSLLFLGIYWNVLPCIFENRHCEPHRGVAISRCSVIVLILAIQWLWCRCQGLYILGPLFALLLLLAKIWSSRKIGEKLSPKAATGLVAFVFALFAMPFLHREGLNLFLYPFGLLDRLLGLSSSAAVFASEIAENRSPITLLLAGENVLESTLMILLCVTGIVWCIRSFFEKGSIGDDASSRSLLGIQNIVLLVTAILALVAERNFVLFLPVLLGVNNLHFSFKHLNVKFYQLSSILVIALLMGFWVRSLSAYDSSMVAYQRVPVDAARWMLDHPHPGRLFNDDRAGGYLAFVNPADSVYIDGRFILKTADFFERYLEYAKNPTLFIADADSLNIDRAVFPLRYYARWGILLQALEKEKKWHRSYQDDYFVLFDRDFTR